MKLSGKSSVSSVLKGILTFFLGIILIAAFLLIFGFITMMINPATETFNSFDDFKFLYELSPQNIDQIIQISQSHPSLANAELKLFGSVNFQMGSRWFVLLFFSFYFLFIGLFINMLIQMRGFLATFEKGNPFVSENVKRIRIVGWTIIVFPILAVIWMFIFMPYFKNLVLMPEMSISFYWKSFLEFSKDLFWAIFMGFVILVVGEGFRLGVEIKSEQELTI